MDDILHLHGYVGTSAISHQGLVDISPALLHNHKKCQPFMGGNHESSEVRGHNKPSITSCKCSRLLLKLNWQITAISVLTIHVNLQL